MLLLLLLFFFSSVVDEKKERKNINKYFLCQKKVNNLYQIFVLIIKFFLTFVHLINDKNKIYIFLLVNDIIFHLDI